MECEQYPDNPDVVTCVKFTPDLLGKCALYNIRKSVPVILEQYIDDPNSDILFCYELITSELADNMIRNSIKGDLDTCLRLKILKVGAFVIEASNHVNPDILTANRLGAGESYDLREEEVDELNDFIKMNCCDGNHEGNYGWGNGIIDGLINDTNGGKHETTRSKDDKGEVFQAVVTVPIKLSKKYDSDIK